MLDDLGILDADEYELPWCDWYLGPEPTNIPDDCDIAGVKGKTDHGRFEEADMLNFEKFIWDD